jgi:hypothetical protein
MRKIRKQSRFPAKQYHKIQVVQLFEFSDTPHCHVEVDNGRRIGRAFEAAMVAGCRALIGHVNL